jgi:glycosyltransferase involved in cell wall biosynthesis
MGGIGRYAWCILQELAQLDRVNRYVCYFTLLEPPEPLSLPENFRVRRFEAGMIDERFDQLVLPTLLDEDAIDVYHNTTFAIPVVRSQARLVSTVHDVVFRRHPEFVEPKLRGYLDRATERAVKGAARIITVSEYSKKEIACLYGASSDKVSVVPNGVFPPPAGNPLEEKAKILLRESGVAPHGYILYVGSIEPKKNISLLLRALAGLKQDLGSGCPQLVLAGSRNSVDYPLEDTIHELGIADKVRVLGYVPGDTLECLYAHALLFVYPSLYEGFGLPPLEAMARGVPTIVSNASSLPEVVGDDAILVDPVNPDDLKRALGELLRDSERRQDLARRGRARANNFTWRRAAESHLEIYRAVSKTYESAASRV